MENRLPNSLLYLMSIAAGLVAANLYYSQPLLNLIAADFQVSESVVGNVVFVAQMGYATGILIIVPLGDKITNIKILKVDFAVLVLALLATAFSPYFTWLLLSLFLVGVASAIPQFFVPMAAELAGDEHSGRAIGVMMTGLISGVIGSRVLSGYLGEHLGWQSIYYLSAVFMAVLFIFIYLKIPRLKPHFTGSYNELYKSLLHILRSNATLRINIILSFLSFAGLTAMWTTLVFLMQDSFGYGSTVTGLFGILGVVSALSAGYIGKLTDKYDRNKIIFYGFLLLMFTWFMFWVSTHFIIGISIGIITLGVADQMIFITNQDIALTQIPGARNRLNTIFMFLFFIGGALGAPLGSIAYEHFGWEGVSMFGLLLTLLLGLIHLRYKKLIG